MFRGRSVRVNLRRVQSAVQWSGNLNAWVGLYTPAAILSNVLLLIHFGRSGLPVSFRYFESDISDGFEIMVDRFVPKSGEQLT